MTRPKVVVVLPAYNAERTLEKTVRDIPPGAVDEIILVADCSKDATAALSRALGLRPVAHARNSATAATRRPATGSPRAGADIVVMVHPDYQYDARLTPRLVGLIANGVCDVVLGNRIRTRREALGGGMPVYKYFFNRLLTGLENSWTGQNLGEWHSGLRAYSRKALETIPWEGNSDDFVFDQQFLHQAAILGLRMGDIPVAARYFEEASSINFQRSVVYGLSTLWVMALSMLHRLGLIRHPLFMPKGVVK